jgi:(p)ppGpp synthase/HD superfamily hydrolase
MPSERKHGRKCRFITRARAFARAAHNGQSRKYTGAPYIEHPIAVAGIAATVPHMPKKIGASLLHDVVKDTPVTIDAIRLGFGEEVADLVSDLTDLSRPEDGTRQREGA